MSDPGVTITDDTLFDGRLICRQYQKGYRFSVDAILLAHFCGPVSGTTILDLGAGCGIIGLLIAHRHRDVLVTGLEIQPRLAHLARENTTQNNFADRITIVNGDFREIDTFFPAESFDMVVSNPPYFPVENSRVNPLSEKACARHELSGDIFHGMKSAAYVVKNKGRVCVIYPAQQITRLFLAMSQVSLTPKRILPVYIHPQEGRARFILVEAIKNGGEDIIFHAPLYLYSVKNGPYSKQMMEYYRDK